MPADTGSTALVNHFLKGGLQRTPEAYYRSKLFIASSTTNPLVSAASPLLSLLERLGLSPTLPSVEAIRDNIEHELLAFHSRLARHAYAHEFVVIADYLLSATIDELLGKNYLRLYEKTVEFKAFTPSSHDDIEPRHRFFQLLHHIKERTHQYLDLLELAYYCLIAGFEGEHHGRADGRQVLDNLIEELHDLIQTHRVNKPKRLFKESNHALTPTMNHKPLMLAGLLAFGIITSSYIGSHLLLEHQASSLLLNAVKQPLVRN